MKKKVLNFIKENSMIKDGDKVLVALSGGPDSVCMLHILHKLKSNLNIEIFAAHVNHCLRGEAAIGDEIYSKELCDKFEIPCYIKRIDIDKLSKEKNISTEMAGREARYNFFDELKENLKIDKIAIAHNANDQAETLIMRAIRGTGIEGLVGIKPIRENLYIRPILCLTRNEIEKYCSINNLKPRIDESNLEEIYSRNKIRLRALPFIEENFNKDIVSTLNRLSYSCSKDVEFIEKTVNEKYNYYCTNNNEFIMIGKEAFLEMDAIITRIIKKALMNISSKCNNFEMKHIYDIINLHKGKTGNKIDITNGVVAINEYGNVKLRLKKDSTKYINNEVVIDVKQELMLNNKVNVDTKRLGNFIFELETLTKGKKFSKDENIKYFDYDMVSNVIIRYRKDGDKIRPLGMRGTKKIKDVLMDAKVPQDLRNSIPLVIFDEEIAWVVGVRVSDTFKVTKDTKKIFKITYMRKE